MMKAHDSMRVSGLRTRDMEEVMNDSRMVVSTKVNLKTISLMGKAR